MALQPVKNEERKRPKSILWVDDEENNNVDKRPEINPDEVVLDNSNEDINPNEVVVDNSDMPRSEFDKIELEAPTWLINRVGSLEKPEDKLREIRSFAPDAQPYGDGNFIMTDPASGKSMVLNREAWIPSSWSEFGNDIVRYGPEIAGGFGGAIGSALGGITGGTAGSVVPVLGTTTGVLAGGTAGGAIGYGAAKDLYRDVNNLITGTQDTRTIPERYVDSAKDLAVGAAGEVGGAIAGRAIGAGAKAVGQGIRKIIPDVAEGMARSTIGKLADDPALVAANKEIFDRVNIDPTPGMVAGDRIAQREFQFAKDNPTVREAIDNVGSKLNQSWDDAVQSYSRGVDLTPAEAGSVIRNSANDLGQIVRNKTNDLYDKVGELTDGTAASGKYVDNFFNSLKGEYEKAGQSVKLNLGKTYEDALNQVEAIRFDVSNGAGFDALKEARTRIGEIAFNSDKAAEKAIYGKFYKALSDDMADTAVAAGNDALTAWQKANRFAARTRQSDGLVSNQQIQKLLRKDTPESIYSLISSGVKNNGTKVDQILKQVRIAGGDDAVRDVGSTVINKIGIDNSGRFSPAQLFRDWDSLSKEGKDALFQFRGGNVIRQNMDNIVAAQKRFLDAEKAGKAVNKNGGWVKDAVLSVARKSGATLDNPVVAIGTSVLSGHPGPAIAYGVKTVGSALIERANQRMFTNPETVKILARVASGENKGSILKTVRRTIKTAGDPLVKSILREYLADIGESE